MKDHYETNVMWKENHSLLIDNTHGSLGSFVNSLKSLRRIYKLETKENIIQEQRANEIIEKIQLQELNETVTEVLVT